MGIEDSAARALPALVDALVFMTAPSRLADGEIFRAVCGRPGDVWRQFGDDDIWHRQDPKDTVAYEPPPYYTASIDAALTLVPDDHGWDINALHGDDPFVTIDEPDTVEFPGHFYQVAHSYGKTAALAICAAALKARLDGARAAEPTP